MPIDLNRVQVSGLFDTFDLDVPIKDNTLIIVGENGSGKSTLINLIYYALTAQWHRLAELPFQSCTITIGNRDYHLIKEDLPSSTERDTALKNYYLERRIPRKYLNIILEQLARHNPEYWLKPEGREKLKSLRNQYPSLLRIPFTVLLEVAQTSSLYEPVDKLEDKNSDVKEELAEVLNSNDKGQVLFLPTYRRIEKELSDVFPDLNLEEITLPSSKYRNVRRQQAAYVELVEFGMTDVAKVFKSTLTELDQEFRSELNRFTGSYLHNILQGLYENVDPKLLAKDDVAETVDLILSRIGEEILSEDDREKLRSLLTDVGSNRELSEQQRISAYFLTNLVRLHQKQQEREIPMRK